MSSTEALLSFQFILEESCSWYDFEISFALERIKVFLAKCFNVVIYGRIFFVSFERWEPFLASNSICF